MHHAPPARPGDQAVAAAEQPPRLDNGTGAGLTILVPAYNEATSIADTVLSLQRQTRPPEEIIVIDDFSTDDTGEIARGLGVTVMRPPQNTGSKSLSDISVMSR